MCYVQCIFKDQEFISAVILWVETCTWTERRVWCRGRRGWIIWLGTTRSIAVQQSGEGNSSSSWCPATYVAARCVGDTTGRAKYRGYKERLWAPVRGAPYTMTLRSPPPRPPFPSPSPGPSVTERTAVNTQHGFNKAYNLRNQCSECQLLPKGRKRQKWEWLHSLWLCTV